MNLLTCVCVFVYVFITYTIPSCGFIYDCIILMTIDIRLRKLKYCNKGLDAILNTIIHGKHFQEYF